MFTDEWIVDTSQTAYDIKAVVAHIFMKIIKALAVLKRVYYFTFLFVAPKYRTRKARPAEQLNNSTRDWFNECGSGVGGVN